LSRDVDWRNARHHAPSDKKIQTGGRNFLKVLAGGAVIFAGVLIAPAFAGGVCSTGAYSSCVVCCKTNAQITNQPLCVHQCGDYKFLEKQKKQQK
jgi:hypothetical protein